MPVRLVSVLVMSGWLVCSPLTIGADRLVNPANTANQQQVRQEALRVTKERERVSKLAFDVIKQSYQAKRRALDGLLAAAKTAFAATRISFVPSIWKRNSFLKSVATFV